MAKQRVERLTLRQFRGGCQPVSFEFNGKKDIVLIFGENGTGKSSIADALDFICNNEFGSLRDRSGTTPRKDVVSLNAQPAELAVELRFGGQQWRATLQGGKPATTPSQPPRAFILRRADITRVMEATPGDRYKTLHAYITVPKVEAAEAELRKAAKEAGQEVDRAVQERVNALEALQQSWKAEGGPEGSAIQWATVQTNVDVGSLTTRLKAARELLARLDQVRDLQARAGAAAAQAQKATTALVAAQAALDQAMAAQLGQSDALIAVLEEAHRYLGGVAEGELACPVCGKPETKHALAVHVTAQLARLNHLQQLRDARVRCQRELTQAQGAQASSRDDFVRGCQALAPLLAGAPPALVTGIAYGALAAVSTDSGSLAAANTVLEQLHDRRPQWMSALEADQKRLNQLNLLQAQLQTIRKADGIMRERQAVAQRLESMQEIVERERKAYVENLIAAISGQVNELYARIHPSEPLGGSSLHVKAAAAGSLELKAHFGGATDISPTAYYSEAHLDTLGLCVYLALAKHSGAGNNIVMLDDILTSADDVHLERIIELIAEEAPNFGHLIITTHSRAWFDRIRNGKGMNADLFELYGWDLANGIRHSRSPLYVDELRQVLAAPRLDRQSAASKAGILLEQILDELTLRYRCKLERKKDPAYTLGELANAFDSKLLKLLRAEQVDATGQWQLIELKALIDKSTGYSWVRNQVGAHFNLSSAGIADSTVREFAGSVVDLAAALVCPSCGQLPSKNKTGEYWQCGGNCGKTRLRPLQAPG